MIWDFMRYRSLPVSDYVISIEDGPKVAKSRAISRQTFDFIEIT